MAGALLGVDGINQVSAANPLPTTGGGGATNGSTAPSTSSSTGFTNAAGNQTAVSPSTGLPVAQVDGQPMPVVGTPTNATVAADGTITATGAWSTYFNASAIGAQSFSFIQNQAANVGFFGGLTAGFAASGNGLNFWYPSSPTFVYNGVTGGNVNNTAVGNTGGSLILVTGSAAGTYKLLGHAQPKQQLGGIPTAAGSVTTATVSSGYTGYEDSAANLAVSATFTSTARTMPAGAQTFGVALKTDGTILLNISQNGIVRSSATYTNGSFDVEIPLRGTGTVQFTAQNTGGSTTTNLSLASSFRTANK